LGCPLVCRFLGRLHHKTIHAQLRQASEKRQGTKSRAGRGGFAAAIYGDLRSSLWGFEEFEGLHSRGWNYGRTAI